MAFATKYSQIRFATQLIAWLSLYVHERGRESCPDHGNIAWLRPANKGRFLFVNRSTPKCNTTVWSKSLVRKLGTHCGPGIRDAWRQEKAGHSSMASRLPRQVVAPVTLWQKPNHCKCVGCLSCAPQDPCSLAWVIPPSWVCSRGVLEESQCEGGLHDLLRTMLTPRWCGCRLAKSARQRTCERGAPVLK